MDSLRPTCSTSASKSTEFDSAEERINLNRSNIASDDIVKILSPNKSNNVNKLHLLKLFFVQLEKQQWHSILKKVALLLKDNDFVISTKVISEHIQWLVYSKSRKGLYCKYCAIFSTSLVNCGVGKNCQKPGKLVIEPLCFFNNLMGSDGYLYEHDRLEYYKSMTIEVRW